VALAFCTGALVLAVASACSSSRSSLPPEEPGGSGAGGGGGGGGGAGTDAAADAGAHKIVFVTSVDYVPGAASSGSFMSAAGADQACNTRAQGSSLLAGRTFKAWISEPGDAGAVGDRITHSTIPYLRTDGVIVGTDYGNLVNHPDLLANIVFDEQGAFIDGGVTVWTGSFDDGGMAPATCQGWQTANAASTGEVGAAPLTSQIGGWSNDRAQACNLRARLYCFEQ
jgi:hypothetical protein